MISKKIIVALISCCLITSHQAAFLKNHSKFDFPRNLVGLNDTAEEWLEPYLQTYDLADFGKDLFDGQAPRHITDALANATSSGDPFANQYAKPDGLPRLREAIAKFYSPLIGHKLNAEENVLVTVGATEALHVAVFGHTTPKDEWIVIEPTYIKYIPIIKMSWGVPRLSPLNLTKTNGTIDGDDWLIDREQLESLFNEKTKGIMLNNPLNPIGKVYKREELEFIAGLAQKYDTLVISDEAHEYMTYDKPHIRIASLPGMFERTLTIGSGSKAFSVSGFRIGWVYGHPNIINHLKVAHLPTVGCAATPQQYALSYAFKKEYDDLGTENSFFAAHARTVKQERDAMQRILTEAGLRVIVADGGFCMLGDWSPLREKLPNGTRTSMDFIVWMIKNIGVVGYPLSLFYGDEHKYMAEDYVRFCYHKDMRTIEDGARRFKKLKDIL